MIKLSKRIWEWFGDDANIVESLYRAAPKRRCQIDDRLHSELLHGFRRDWRRVRRAVHDQLLEDTS